MQYEIFSIGDPAFLAETLKATTTILNRDGLGGIVAIGFLFTFIWTIVQGVLSGGKEIKIQNIIMAGLIYAAFFGMKVDRMEIWGLHTMEFHQVEDVPLGLAFSGTVISKVGNKITEWFEQEYTVIGMSSSELGTGFALKALYEMRGLGFSDGSLKWDPNGHLTKTLDNYISDCVVPATTIGTEDSSQRYNGMPAINLKNVVEQESAWEHLQWKNHVYATKVYPYLSADPTPADKTKVMTCGDAYDYITEKWINNPAVIDQWMGNIGEAVCNDAGYGCEAFKTSSGQFDKSSFAHSFALMRDSILRTDANLDKMLMNRALLVPLSKMSANDIGNGDTLISAVTGRASAQITANQALQQTMFEKMMLPLMTFFEALMYVAAPFAAILVAFGLGGIQMIGKYLVFALWIQLWKPVAAVGNMFIQMSISGEMSNLNGFAVSKGHSLASLSNQPEVFDSLQHWIGVGGMLVASTPAITLMLMYGSAVTASSLAGRIDMGKGSDVGMDGFSGQSKMGDTKASLTKDGSIAMGNDQTRDATQGTISMGATMKNEAQKSESIARSETKKAEEARGQALESVTSAGTGISERQATIETAGGDSVSSQQYSQTMANKLVKQHGLSDTEASSVRAGVNAKASAGADFGKLMGKLADKKVDTSGVKGAGHLGMIMHALDGKVGGGADYQEQFDKAAQETEQLSNIVDSSWQDTESDRTSITQGWKGSGEDSITQSKEWRDSEKHTQTAQRSTAKAQSAEQRASFLKSRAGTSGYSQQFEIATLSADAANRGGMKEFGQFLEAKQAQGDTAYSGIEANIGGYRAALRTAQAEGSLGDTAELMSMAGQNVDNPMPRTGVGALSQELYNENGAPRVGGAGPIGDQTQNQAASSLSQGVKNTLESTGGATGQQKQQIDKNAGRNLSAKEQELAGQSAALSANGGMSTQQEGQMRDMLRASGVNSSEATSGNQLALAVSGMGEKMQGGMAPQQAFDASLAESQEMADLGEQVGSATAEGAGQGGADTLTTDGAGGSNGAGTGTGNGSGDAASGGSAGAVANSAQKTLKDTGGATQQQQQQINNQADRKLSGNEQKMAGQAAALASNGGLSQNQEGNMRASLGQAGVDSSGATSGTQLALASAGMGAKLAEGMAPQQAFDASLAESQEMADLGEQVGSATAEGADPDAAAPLTNDGTDAATGGDAEASGDNGAGGDGDAGAGAGSGVATAAGGDGDAGSGAATAAGGGGDAGAGSGTAAGAGGGATGGAGGGTAAGAGSGTAGGGNGAGSGQSQKSGKQPGKAPKQPKQVPAAVGSVDKKGGLDFMSSDGAKNAASLLNNDLPPLSQDGQMNLDSIDSTQRDNATHQWLNDHPEVDPENLTKEQGRQYLEDMGLLEEGEMNGVTKDGDQVAQDNKQAMNDSELGQTGGKGKALMDFLDTGMIQAAAAGSGVGSTAGMAVGGTAGAIFSAKAAQAAGKSVAMGMLRGAATGAFRGGAWGAVAGVAVGAAQGYMAYKDTVDQENRDQAGQELKKITGPQGNGDFSQLSNTSQEVVNKTLEGVIAKQVEAMDKAAAQGETFDAQDFRNNELDTFEQQVFDQGDALLSSGQGFADELGMDMAGAIENGQEEREEKEMGFLTGRY